MNASVFSQSGRLMLWWDSPIPAGLFLAMLVPWALFLCTLPGKLRALRMLLWAAGGTLTITLIVGLALTQSRGPILATGLSLAIGLWYAQRLPSSIRRRQQLLIGGTIAALVIASFALGATARLKPGAITHDGSIHNRLAIWHAAPEMLFLRPIEGLGAGESGYIYSQWYQPEATAYRYRTVLNGYLELGIEHGVWVFIILVAIAVAIGGSWLATRNNAAPSPTGRAAHLSANLSLLVYLLGSATSVFTAYRLLGAIAAIDFGLCIHALLRWADRRAVFRLSTWGTVAGLGLALAAGYTARHPTAPIHVGVRPDRVVELSRSTTANKSGTATVLVDREVLGATYGQTIRRFLAHSSLISDLRIPDPRFPIQADTLGECEVLVFFGRTSRFTPLVSPNKVQRVVFVHPGTPPGDLADGIETEVWLPAHDELGIAPDWEAWARTHRSLLRRTTSEGQSLTGALPEL